MQSETVVTLVTKTAGELQEYCAANIQVCSDDNLWKALLELQFPEVFLLSTRVKLPDLEEGRRREDRKFLPFRELYMQLLVFVERDDRLKVIIGLINNDHLQPNKIIFEELRNYYQILSFILSHTSIQWFLYLTILQDPIVRFQSDELREFSKRVQESERVKEILPAESVRENFIDEDDINELLWELFSLRIPKEVIELYITRNDNSATWVLGNAILHGDLDTVRYLNDDPRVDLSEIGSLWEIYNYPLDMAIESGSEDMVKFYLAKYESKSGEYDDRGSFLLRAAEKPNAGVLTALLKDGRFDPNDDTYSAFPLEVAVGKGLVDNVEALLADSRTNPFKNNNSAVRTAIRKYSPNILRYILKDPRVVLSENPLDLAYWMLQYGVTEQLPLLEKNNRTITQDVINTAIINGDDHMFTKVLRYQFADK